MSVGQSGVGRGSVADYVPTSSTVADGVTALQPEFYTGRTVVQDLMNLQVLFYSPRSGGFLNTLGVGTLFTDTAGTTPVTTIGDTIALGLDQSGNSNDMVQATAAARPVYGRMPVSGAVNLLTHTEDFGNAAWVKNFATITQDTTTAPDGTAADKIIANAAFAAHYVTQHSASVGVGYTVSCFMKAGEYDYGYFSGVGTLNAIFDLINGTVTATNGWTNAAITDVGGGWYLCSASVVAASTGPFRFGVATDPSDGIFLGDGTSGIYIWGAQIVLGATLLPYQRVGAGPYDITQPGTTSVPIAYLDTSDDNFSWTLPAGTYHLFIAGDLGCYFDTVAHAGGEFTVGPTSWTGGPDGAITTLIGQRHVIMPVIRDEAFTQFEKAQLVAYAMARGGGEVWNKTVVWDGSGVPSVVGSNWTNDGGGLWSNDGAGSGPQHLLQLDPSSPAPGTLYDIRWSVLSRSAGSVREYAGGSTPLLTAGSTGNYRVIAPKLESNNNVGIVATATFVGQVGSIYAERLTQSSTPT